MAQHATAQLPRCIDMTHTKTHMHSEVKRLKAWRKQPICFPGGYQIALYIDGARCCADCLLSDWEYLIDRMHPSAYGRAPEIVLGVYWEGDLEFCNTCTTSFESEYGPTDDG